MPVAGTLITKASIVAQVNADIVDQKNARVVWWSGNPVNPNPGFAAKLTQMSTGNLAATLVTASEIVAQARAFANDGTRIRQVQSRQFRPSCGDFSINNGIQISALNTGFYVTSIQTTINSTPGPTAGTIISAASINNFTNTLKGLTNGSESGTFLVDATTNDGCHCSCHSACHSACHTSCHGSCHGSRARR
jgi:hypothetical protein